MVRMIARVLGSGRIPALAAAWLAGAVAAGCAPKPAPGMASVDGRQCFYAERIDGFTAVSDRLVNVSVGAGEAYQFELFGPCPDVDWASRIAVVSHGSSWICSGLDATVIAPSVLGQQRCPVRRITRLPPAPRP